MRIPHLRWYIIGLVFLATVINYIDRLTISVLAPVITKDLGLTNVQFGTITTSFLLAYTISQALSGKLYDIVGTRRGFTISITIWSAAAMATAFARSLAGLSAIRFVLGLGEAGNWPGAAKTVAEWFPVRDRAFAMAIFNSGAALGAVAAPPLIVWLQLQYGWQTTFVATGALGFAWLVLWLAVFRQPDAHPWITPEERALIAADRDLPPEGGSHEYWAPRWVSLLRYRQVWAIVLARFITDPIWWLYITWLPKYLNDARGFSLVQIGLYAWVPYLAADLGSLSGGYASGALIRRGWSVDRARKTVIVTAALLMPAGVFAVRAPDPMVALALMCVVLFAFQVWINNVQTLPSDFFPSSAVGSVAGLGGMGAGIGSMLFTMLTGWLVDHFSYTPVFTIAGLLGPLGTIVLFLLAGRIMPTTKSSAGTQRHKEPKTRSSLAKSFRVFLFIVSLCSLANNASAQPTPPGFSELLAKPVSLKPELQGVHPRVFVTAAELDTLRQRANTTHRDVWSRVLTNLVATRRDPPPPPGPQERRSQNDVSFAIAEVSLAYQIERKPEYLAAARTWILAAIDYEPWGYTYNKPNVDLAAGHLLYSLGWAYDLLYHELTPAERARIRASLERHAGLVYDYFSPGKGKRFNFTQNHNVIPTSGLAVTALALMGESTAAPRWAALARAHHHRAGMLLSPDGYYYEGVEYWIFSTPWLVHFLDAWEHSTGESLWDRDIYRNWKLYVAHSMLPDGQSVFDFGDIWEGPLTRARGGAEYNRVYPGGTLQSNYNVLYGVARRFRDPETQAVAARLASFGHSNLEEYWTLIWRDPSIAPAPITRLPLTHHFADSGVVFHRTSWNADATAFAFKSGPPEGHRVAALLEQVPEWRLSSGHAHPDANSFIIWANGRYLIGDTGYAGIPQARHHNTVVVGGVGQGNEGKHDVWAGLPYDRLAAIKISEVTQEGGAVRIVADAAGAYPPQAHLRRFTRSFTLDPTGTFVIRDQIETDSPRVIESYFHADAPIRSAGTGFTTTNGGVELRGEVAADSLIRVSSGETMLTSPGQPGAIEKGATDQRGYEVVVRTASPVTKLVATVTLTVIKGS